MSTKPKRQLNMEKLFKHGLQIACICLLPVVSYGQKDSLVMTNGDIMVGEIKSLEKGVLYVESPYSDKDFNVKWSEIQEIYATTRFLVTLQEGNSNGELFMA